MLRVLFIGIAATIILGSAKAQIGVHSQYVVQDIPNLSIPAHNDDVMSNLYGLGISYWFRLKKVRWEISPTLYLHNRLGRNNAAETSFEQKAYSLHIQNNLYILDFKNDCMCPTFSKQGEWIRKGLFLFGAPGIGLRNYFLNEVSQDQDLYFYGELGAGIDFGINNIITLTPQLGYRQLFGNESLVNVVSKNSFNQIVPSLKVTFRWDKENFYRRR